MRFSSDVLPRQPLTCAQPVMPGLHLVAQHVLRDAVLELLDEVAAARAAGRRSTCRRAARSRAAAARRGSSGAGSGRAACTRGSSSRAHTGPVSRFGVVVHRAELEDRERLAVEAHALLAVEHRARATCSLTSAAMMRERDRQHEQRRARRSRRRSPRLTTLLKPCSGTSLMLMTGTPSRSSSRARSAMTCSRSGTTLTSTHSRLVALDQLEHLARALRAAARRRGDRSARARTISPASSSVPSSGRPR